MLNFKKIRLWIGVFLWLLLSSHNLSAEYSISLREQLLKAHPGDFVVTSQNKNYTLLHIKEVNHQILTIEEITVPECRYPKALSWQNWVSKGSPGHTSWVLYTIRPSTASIESCYSVNKHAWVNPSQLASFLPTLLNLRLNHIPPEHRKRVGIPPMGGLLDSRPIWEPKMVINGRTVPNVSFEGWWTKWPADGSELAGKTIELYLPADVAAYPSYFPYWIQVRGRVGKVTIRIIDSGSQLASIQQLPKHT